MGTARLGHWLLGAALLGILISAGCAAVSAIGGGTLFEPELEDNENAAEPDAIVVEVYATNTGDAIGIALDADGDLYLVNERGLFGPIEAGDDIAAMDPFGATNLADEDLYRSEPTRLVLAISNSGEFFIGSPGSGILGVVPPEGGPAEPFGNLLTEPTPDDPSNIKPETMVIVPDAFDGTQIRPGTLLVGRETSFSELSTIDVESEERTVLNIDNPIGDPDELDNPEDALNRNAYHLVFSPDGGTLYSSSSQLRLGTPGIQTIALDGTPSEVAGTEAILAHSFVVLDNGDLVIRGSYDPGDDPTIGGLLLWSAEDEQVTFTIDVPDSEVSVDDELILGPGGDTLFISAPRLGQILRATDNR